MTAHRGRARVGCSGWSYRDWRGIVYPENLRPNQWFEHYATMFDTVELNNTFYRLPTVHAVEQWAAAAPEGFVFALKLGAFGTHRKKLRDPLSWLPNHLDRAQRFGPSIGPNLIQLPPRWRRNAARLDEFLSIAPTTMRWAVELRDPSWLHEETYDVLRRHKAALCVHDLLPDHPFMLTTNWTYVRFHGPNAISRPYHGAYGACLLEPWASRLRGELDAGHDVYCYFNNDYYGHAVTDALWLRSTLATRHD
jgi:uncharacterized protein YecE (DUF72 family)